MAARVPGRAKVMLANYIPTALTVPTIEGTPVDNAVWTVVTSPTSAAFALMAASFSWMAGRSCASIHFPT